MFIVNFVLNEDGTYIIVEMSANHNVFLQNALDTINSVKECEVNVIFGFLDHTIGSTALTLAIALGVKVIEKYFLEVLHTNSINEINKIIKKYKIDMLLIDHYEIDIKYEKKLKKLHSDLKIIILDDTYNKHHSDVLLNHNIYVKKKIYKGLFPKKCKLFCSEKYTFLRDEFKKENFIFIVMGGIDIASLNINILKVIKEFKNLQVLQSYCNKNKQVKLRINSNKVAKLMEIRKLTIITPSVTANESYFMNLSFIAIKTAENQKYMYSYLKKSNKYLIIKQYPSSKLKKNIQRLLYA